MTPQQVYYCSECGRQTPPEELARFGDRLVCSYCKNTYAQKLREGVAPMTAMQYGGFWMRFVAMLIDGIILAIPIGILEVVVFGAMGMSMARLGDNPNPEDVFAMLGPLFAMIGLVSLISLALGVSYETFFVVKYGATPGKMALGLKVVRPDGTMLTMGRAAGRYFAKMLSGMIMYIGYIMAGFDDEKRGLHDRICDTRVIKARG
ncbi:MAG TPA: RDD family protein [Verrucomicrobiae bacterium]|nr:RDD family protein [Verrucomicrobiae bacterium]